MIKLGANITDIALHEDVDILEMIHAIDPHTIPKGKMFTFCFQGSNINNFLEGYTPLHRLSTTDRASTTDVNKLVAMGVNINATDDGIFKLSISFIFFHD